MCGNIHPSFSFFHFKRDGLCFPNLRETLELMKILIICLFMRFVWPFFSRHKHLSKFCIVTIVQRLSWLGMLGLCCHLPDVHVIRWGHLSVSTCSACQAPSCCVTYCHPCCFSGGSYASAELAGKALKTSNCMLMQSVTHTHTCFYRLQVCE